MRTLRDIPHLEGVPVLVRIAMNVPIEHGRVTNDYRLRRAVPTIRYLVERGARVILISHIGEQGTETLEPAASALSKLVPHTSFFPETIGPRAREAIRNLLSGEVLILENLRRNRGEVMNDPEFARELASLADVFVQDSFDTCHRNHASIVGVPNLLPSYAGLLVEEETTELMKMLTPRHPSIAVIGGAKFSTKETLLSKLLEAYDTVFVGGALATDFFKASGREVGKSLISGANKEAISTLLNNPRLALPVDVLVVPQKLVGTPSALAAARAVDIAHIQPDDVILDHGPQTRSILTAMAGHAQTILWNGPLGNYENGFVEATDDFARAVAASEAHSVVGGGDTVASIESLDLLPQFSFVSTGGGAMLDLLTHGTLPGIEALM